MESSWYLLGELIELIFIAHYVRPWTASENLWPKLVLLFVIIIYMLFFFSVNNNSWLEEITSLYL